MMTYQNPVFPHNFPDPFVLKYCGEYWAYCTGPWQDDRIFGILRSPDLVNWQEVGGAMTRLPGDHPCYWAPEVIYDNGRFYLYYSLGNEVNMHIRVAMATHPAGPFMDQGVRLTREKFAIDAHVFTDENGQRYLFYATDFLDHERVGTGTVMDRLLDPFTLAGQPRPVTRARYDWQIYDPQRREKGGVRWHTIEGSFVLKRKGVYYQMFSGGNWQNPSYGVGYATTHDLDTTEEWLQACDGERVLPILCTVPDQIIGPGHNSVVRGPNNCQMYCIYHRWNNNKNGRQLAIDPLDFAGDRMLILGPSHKPQPQPLPPTFADFFKGHGLDGRWQVTGQWQVKDGAAMPVGKSGETAVLTYTVSGSAFLAEVSIRALEPDGSAYGLNLSDGETDIFQLRFGLEQNHVIVSCPRVRGDGAGWQAPSLPLPEEFNFNVYHLLRVVVNGRYISLYLDDRTLCWQGEVAKAPTTIALFAGESQVAFSGFSLTAGWQDCFETETTPADLDWEGDNLADWIIRRQQLCFANSTCESMLQKGPCLAAYELVVNVRLDSNHEQGCYGIAPALTSAGAGPLFTIQPAGAGWAAHWQDGQNEQIFPLPVHFDPLVYQQFRFRKENSRLSINWEQKAIATVPAPPEPTRIGVYGRGAAAFDMVRVTSY